MGAAGGSGRTGGAHGAGRTGGAHGSAGSTGPAGAADRSGPQEGGYTVTDTRQSPHQPPAAYPPPRPSDAPGGTGTSAAAAGVRRPRPAARTAPRTRKARLRVSKADPWSVMKVSFLLSIALGICTIVAVAVLWMVLDTIGVFSAVGSTISDATSTEGGKGGFDLVSFLSLSRVLLFTTVIAVIDVVLATALATLGAFIYNLSSNFVGGVELTLAEDE
ncbi:MULTISPECIES: DUF3566 domain-containing protein [Streptomycetaceae]|uniref:DUF3566 domain-containing protein n=1 Tax=Streptomycetaceae TaxID=2062 RepID=UPI003EB72A83